MASGRLGFGGSWTTGVPRRGPHFTTTSGIGSFGRPAASQGSGWTEWSRSQLLQEGHGDDSSTRASGDTGQAARRRLHKQM